MAAKVAGYSRLSNITGLFLSQLVKRIDEDQGVAYFFLKKIRTGTPVKE
jgi:hypothetical protein